MESCTQALCDVALSFGDSDQEGGMVSKAPMAQGESMLTVRFLCAQLLSLRSGQQGAAEGSDL